MLGGKVNLYCIVALYTIIRECEKKKKKQVLLFSKSILSRGRSTPARLVYFRFSSSGVLELSLWTRAWPACARVLKRFLAWREATPTHGKPVGSSPPSGGIFAAFISRSPFREQRAARQLRGFSTGVNDSQLFSSNAAVQRGGTPSAAQEACYSLVLFFCFSFAFCFFVLPFPPAQAG